eukprot:3994614-Alexandrium_andersonii.AAC.1
MSTDKAPPATTPMSANPLRCPRKRAPPSRKCGRYRLLRQADHVGPCRARGCQSCARLLRRRWPVLPSSPCTSPSTRM